MTDDGSMVCVGCYDGHVYFLCATTGQIRWKFDTGGEVKSWLCLDPRSKVIWVGSHGCCLYALDYLNKKVKKKLVLLIHRCPLGLKQPNLSLALQLFSNSLIRFFLQTNQALSTHSRLMITMDGLLLGNTR